MCVQTVGPVIFLALVIKRKRKTRMRPVPAEVMPVYNQPPMMPMPHQGLLPVVDLVAEVAAAPAETVNPPPPALPIVTEAYPVYPVMPPPQADIDYGYSPYSIVDSWFNSTPEAKKDGSEKSSSSSSSSSGSD
ncbi:hypothetical protein J8273_7777 [Carpediemonas membranifera]|uniref:Uncharacterized protein n=1 Tax=Carpediemonas membranifera TaxID=201153 RepID=A0A8J6E1B7_9EUKA|nr:hypothetical protein J8273_7777 [Carpediemonas membranifera]|eukprot:KAG9390427.1 hypothetical protein J8273_7777 [Carpediemonas membranifera]